MLCGDLHVQGRESRNETRCRQVRGWHRHRGDDDTRLEVGGDGRIWGKRADPRLDVSLRIGCRHQPAERGGAVGVLHDPQDLRLLSEDQGRIRHETQDHHKDRGPDHGLDRGRSLFFLEKTTENFA